MAGSVVLAWIVIIIGLVVGAVAHGQSPPDMNLAIISLAASSTALGWLLLRSAILSAFRQDRRERDAGSGP